MVAYREVPQACHLGGGALVECFEKMPVSGAPPNEHTAVQMAGWAVWRKVPAAENPDERFGKMPAAEVHDDCMAERASS